ncbi:MAG TPA: isoamylase early set domain-containing protein [Longimicrobiales bacterium]|nr:isoamylase early set domain-containing protein [Longimicrobiales bacterium]
MRDELQRYLDGELERDALPPELAEEAERWNRWLNATAELRADQAPPWLETAVMAQLPPRGAAIRRFVAWLMEPKTVRIRPAVGVAAMAFALAVLMLWPRTPTLQPVATAPANTGAQLTSLGGAGSPVIYVQFVYAGPVKTSVAVAGDFNNWDPDRNMLQDPDGDGVWTGLFPLTPGVHKYMFVVDGSRWVTDPRAASYVDDGFGGRNALISIGAGKAS